MSEKNRPFTLDESRTALIARVAHRVRDLRKQMGLPRRVVSERSGVSSRYLAQLEAAEGNISIALLERVAQALEVPIEVLIAKTPAHDAETQRVAGLYAAAPKEVRAQVGALLAAPVPAPARAGNGA